ncbi:hypothetical protein [Mycolicibacterium sp.]|uniref:hypothetical protein n=1 Tax=Mycolicibacterium sp. TaxID=2320850 RepID=UPI0037CB5884
MVMNTDVAALAIRDQLASELREAGRPLSTMQLAARCGIPWHTVRLVDASCSWAQAFAEHRYGAVLECRDHAHTVAVPPLPGMVHPLLVDLEAAGIITRVTDPGIGQHAVDGFVRHANHAWMTWRYTGPVSDPEFDAIVADF